MVISPIAYWRVKNSYYNLVGSKCRGCGKEWFPPVNRCLKCGSRDLDEKPMPREGRVITYTTTLQLGESFKNYRPLTIGLVELDNGVRVVGQLVDFKPGELRTGARVVAVVRKLREDPEGGLIFYGYKFAPKQP